MAVQFQQVKGEQEHGAVLAPVAQPVEHRHAIAVAGHRLAVQEKRARFQGACGLCDQREAVRPVMPIACDQPDPRRVAADHQAKAVMLDFVDPGGAARRAISP